METLREITWLMWILFLEGLKGFGMAILLISIVAAGMALAFGPAMLSIEMFETGHEILGTMAAIVGVMIYGLAFKIS